MEGINFYKFLYWLPMIILSISYIIYYTYQGGLEFIKGILILAIIIILLLIYEHYMLKKAFEFERRKTKQ